MRGGWWRFWGGRLLRGGGFDWVTADRRKASSIRSQFLVIDMMSQMQPLPRKGCAELGTGVVVKNLDKWDGYISRVQRFWEMSSEGWISEKQKEVCKEGDDLI